VLARISSALGTLAGLVVIGVVLWAVVEGIRSSPEVVGSFATATGAVLAVVFQRDRENKREIARLHREQLAPIYEDLFKRFKEGFDAEDPEDEAFVLDLQRKLIFYGATPVVVEWLKWMRSIPDDEEERDESDPSLLLRWERVLFAIRRDLGHNNEGLSPGDLLRVYVPDFDEYHLAWLMRKNSN
jgi:hypothetical protein